MSHGLEDIWQHHWTIQYRPQRFPFLGLKVAVQSFSRYKAKPEDQWSCKRSPDI